MATKKSTEVTIKPIREETTVIRLIGDTPLIVHKWDVKMKRMLKAGQAAYGSSDITEKAEHPGMYESFINSMYWIKGKPSEYTEEAFVNALENGAEFGFRVESFKQAAIDAAYTKKWIPNKKGVKGLFFIEPDAVDEEGYQLVKLQGDWPVMREDVVILSGMSRTPDLRWRGQFTNWFVDLRIRYDADGVYTLQDIINMLNAGGHYNGVGEYRPEKDGQFGMYHVEVRK